MKPAIFVLSVAFAAVTGLARADELRIQAGTSLSLGSGKTQLNCGDLIVGGTLRGQSSVVAGLGSVQILGGVLDADTATLVVSGTWNNAGTFDAGASTVRMTGACTSSLAVAGNNRFCNLEVDAPGATISFPSGSTVVGCRLVLRGAPGTPLTLVSAGARSSVCVPTSQIVTSDVTYNRDAVSVSDCTPGVPAAGSSALVLLMLGLVGVGAMALRRRRA